jgi:hypothetical protein
MYVYHFVTDGKRCVYFFLDTEDKPFGIVIQVYRVECSFFRPLLRGGNNQLVADYYRRRRYGISRVYPLYKLAVRDVEYINIAVQTADKDFIVISYRTGPEPVTGSVFVFVISRVSP